MKLAVKKLPGILKSSRVALVDFMSPTCQYCGPVPGVLKELQRRHPVDVYVVDVNDDIRTVSNLYRVQSLPTVILFKGGQEVTRTTGALSLSEALRRFGPQLR